MISNISNATKENFHIDKKDVSYLLDINLRLDIIKIKNEAVDIKLYTISRYNELCTKPGFEKSILENLIDIRRW